MMARECFHEEQHKLEETLFKPPSNPFLSIASRFSAWSYHPALNMWRFDVECAPGRGLQSQGQRKRWGMEWGRHGNSFGDQTHGDAEGNTWCWEINSAGESSTYDWYRIPIKGVWVTYLHLDLTCLTRPLSLLSSKSCNFPQCIYCNTQEKSICSSYLQPGMWFLG